MGPLHHFAERRGYPELIRQNGLNLLAAAHVLRLRGDEDPAHTRAMAAQALDRFELLATQGDADAAFQVAEAYRTGFGRPGNHWKALEAYDRAADLGHLEAAERRQRLAAGEAVLDDSHERFARQALLKATYGRSAGEGRAASTWYGIRDLWEHGIGLKATLVLLGAALLVAVYIGLDLYFFGMGHWRPDPSRVAWGLLGKINPPQDGTTHRVLPAWLRPDAQSATFDQANYTADGREVRTFAIGDYQGQVVLLYVVDEKHPILNESQACLLDLQERLAGRAEVLVVFIPGRTSVEVNRAWIQGISRIRVCAPLTPRSLRPLGAITTFPMTFILDRKGRIRQRWAGFGQAITEKALADALAEPA